MKKLEYKYNKCNPYAAANNYHLTKHCQAAVCLSAKHELMLLGLSLVILVRSSLWVARSLFIF